MPNQAMKPTAPSRSDFNVTATTLRIVLLAAASFALASCETTQVVYVWSKPGVTQSQFERDKLDCLNEVIDVLKVGGLKNYAAIQIECMKRKGYTYQRQHLKPSEARKLSSN